MFSIENKQILCHHIDSGITLLSCSLELNPPLPVPIQWINTNWKPSENTSTRNLTKDWFECLVFQQRNQYFSWEKPNGNLRFFIDYRGPNAITIRNRHSLPLITETLISYLTPSTIQSWALSLTSINFVPRKAINGMRLLLIETDCLSPLSFLLAYITDLCLSKLT